jgi:hypothetical protein
LADPSECVAFVGQLPAAPAFLSTINRGPAVSVKLILNQMPREGLPLKTTGEPKKLAKSQSGTEVFGFTPEEGKEYVYKEIEPRSRIFRWYRGRTLEETASLMQKASDILKRHLGDYVVPAHFIIAENKDGEPCIMVVQEKVRGKTLDAIMDEQLPENLTARARYNLKHGLYGISADALQQRTEITKRLKEAEEDPDLLELFEAGKLVAGRKGEFFSLEAMFWENQIVDEEGRIRVVDW